MKKLQIKLAVIFSTIFTLELGADTRTITFENLTRESANFLRIQFESRVEVNLSADITAPDANPNTVPFERDNLDEDGTKHNFFGGSVPGSPSGEQGSGG